MTTKQWFATTAAVLGLTALPAVAGAQVCAGFPTDNGQTSLSIAANFPENADQFGAELSANVPGPLAVFGGYTRTTLSDSTGQHANTFSAGAALDIGQQFQGAFPLALSACPVASANLTQLEGVDVWRVPVGVGLGGRIAVGPPGTLELMPFVMPQLVWTRVDYEENARSNGGLFGSLFGSPDEPTPQDSEETNLALRSGLLLGAGRFYFGAEFNNILNDRVDPVLGVKAGVRF